MSDIQLSLQFEHLTLNQLVSLRQITKEQLKVIHNNLVFKVNNLPNYIAEDYLANRYTSPEILLLLAAHPNRFIRGGVIRHEEVTPGILYKLATIETFESNRLLIAEHPLTPKDALIKMVQDSYKYVHIYAIGDESPADKIIYERAESHKDIELLWAIFNHTSFIMWRELATISLHKLGQKIPQYCRCYYTDDFKPLDEDLKQSEGDVPEDWVLVIKENIAEP